MNRLGALRQAVSDKDTALTTLKAEVRAAMDGGAKMTADQKTRLVAAQADLDAAREELKDYESVLAAETSPTARVTVQVRDRAENDPMRGFATPREFLSAVMAFGRRSRMDARLEPLRAPMSAAAGSDEAGEYSDPYGNFLVPVAISPTILQLQPEDDPTAAAVTSIPMEAPTVGINARVDKVHSTSVSGGLVVTRKPETVAPSGSRMQFEQVMLTARNLFGLGFATEEILVDSPASFIATLQVGFRDQYGWHLLGERLRGTGAGEFMGVLNAPCTITVAKEGGQKAATITKENIDKMIARCWRYGRAVWLGNQTTLPQLSSIAQVVGTGGNTVPYFTFNPGGQSYLAGRPFYFTEHCSALGTVGDLVLGVWSEFIEGTYQPLQQAESMHVRFVEHERTFKFWLRNDGQPWWKTALTPKNGDTLSPFVTLATRS
jgi:HK97 family phage major capsid protein